MSIKGNWLCFRISAVFFLEKYWEARVNCFWTYQIQTDKVIIETYVYYSKSYVKSSKNTFLRKEKKTYLFILSKIYLCIRRLFLPAVIIALPLRSFPWATSGSVIITAAHLSLTDGHRGGSLENNIFPWWIFLWGEWNKSKSCP